MFIDTDFFKKITFVDFNTLHSTNGCLYPPYFLWHQVNNYKKMEDEIKNSIKKSSNDFAIYIHFPFCLSRCSFCRFYSLANKNSKKYDEFLDLMIKELEIWVKLIRSSRKIKGKIPLESIYCGGGTPSLFNLEKFFKVINNHFDIKNAKQVNVESSLDSLSKEKLHLYKKIGINRLLIGIQSFDKNVLKKMNRSSNNVDSFEKLYKLAKKIGISHINTELIAGLPEQTKKSFLNDVKRLIELKVDSIHKYRLIVTPLSTLGKLGYRHNFKTKINILKILDKANSILSCNGYFPEDSEWVLPGKEKDKNFQTNFSIANKINIGLSANGHIKSDDFRLLFANTINVVKYKNRVNKNKLAIDRCSILKSKEEFFRVFLVNNMMRFSHFKINDNMKELFNKEFRFLEDKKIIKIEGNIIKNNLIKKNKNNFYRFVYPKVFYSKIFYSPEILKECKRVINQKYTDLIDLDF